MFQLGSNKRTLFAQVFLSTVLATSCLYSQQDVQQESKQQLEDLISAIRRKDTDVVQQIISSSNREQLLNAHDDCNYTPLWYALRDNHFDIARVLLENGADLNACDKKGWTFLHYATFFGPETINNREMKSAAKFLIENGADVNVRDNNDRTPLHYAAANDFLFELLVEKGADLNAQDQWGLTPLHVAGREDKFNVVKHLVEMGADTQLRSNRGDTLMHEVLELGHVRIVKYFVEKQERATAAEALKETELPAGLQKLVYDLVFESEERDKWLCGIVASRV